ncbi:heme exporter protein C [Anoxybacillus tengchongensis]|uniref:Heme exporter protein C n=1 Tax=Anoxybacillus tengchongensis TaxID=576944 RepID=A0A7W9YNG2_9BACL|nr:cytochrome c biogenesis protein [Anoxybacillus tengchongensis]MBB6175408.1 heme exporter protein C [Anoxybacillus tengchongensis]
MKRLDAILLACSAVCMFIALYMVFIWSPIEVKMGVVQKIFYIHVSSAWVSFLAFFVVFICSLLVIWKSNELAYHIAGASAEIGVVFTAIVLTTGPIWARSAWNTWWTWEPRLTTTLILFFMYIGYLLLRQSDGERNKVARFSSAFGLVAFINVPIVFMAIRWWNSRLHPVVFGDGKNQKGGGVEPEMLLTLIVCVVTMTFLYVVLVRKGVRIARMKEKIKMYMEQVYTHFS